MIFVGDVGGTNTRLALFAKGKLVRVENYLSSLYPSLESVMDRFLKPEEKIRQAVFALAGPIYHQSCQLTNLSWKVEAARLQEKLKIERVSLINDLLAHGYGINMLKEEDFYFLQKGKSAINENLAILAAGTGLGEVGILKKEGCYLPFATEGGHGDFAPRSSIEFDLLVFLQKKYGHVSTERVLSGPGLVDIYRFFLLTEKNVQNPLDVSLAEAAQKITEAANNQTNTIATKTLDLFISLLGAEAGNVALRYLALGGLYLGGGIAPKILNEKGKERFLRAFLDKGRLSFLLEKIPVSIILNDRSALYGAYIYAKEKQAKEQPV